MASKSAKYAVSQSYDGAPLNFDVQVFEAKDIPEEEAETAITHDCTKQGCTFKARSAHGLARHIHAKHGFGALGKGLTR